MKHDVKKSAAVIAAMTAAVVCMSCSAKTEESETSVTSTTTTTTSLETTEETISASETEGISASQELYMSPRPHPSDSEVNELVVDGYTIDDMSVIEDEDLRELAQSFSNQGFAVNDPYVEQTLGYAPGDNEMMFNTGFTAYSLEPSEDYVYWNIYAYKMDEDLFMEYIAGEDPRWDLYIFDEWDSFTDDGTVIRAISRTGEIEYMVEFDRETGIATMNDIRLTSSD